MKYRIIANPAAGKGNGRLLIPRVVERLKGYGLDFDLVTTEHPWHAAKLAREAAGLGYEAVVAAGGDGTCNEVLNGLMQARQDQSARPSLGVICIGRGNDFAYGAGLPTHWEDGCRTLAYGIQRSIDVGFIRGDCLNGGRYFGNGIGIGFDATVNIQATGSRFSGFLGYTIAALRTILLHFKSPVMKIECEDDTLTQPSIMVSVMNGKRMGGGFLMTPDSSIRDGKLDLCIAHRVGRITILLMIPRFMQGTQAGHPAIRFLRSRKAVVTALNDTLPFHVDGETICTDARQLTIEIVPDGIDVISLLDGQGQQA